MVTGFASAFAATGAVVPSLAAAGCININSFEFHAVRSYFCANECKIKLAFHRHIINNKQGEHTCGGMDGTLVPLCSGLCRFSPFHSLSVSSESSNCDFHCEARVSPPPPFVTCCSADTLSSSICANCVIEQSRTAERPPLTCCRLSALLLGSLLRGSLCSVT